MSADTWGLIAGLGIQALIFAVGYGILHNKVSTAANGIKWLTDNKVSRETGDGYQAQLNRLERQNAECEGKMSSMREEIDGRAERINGRIDHIEKNRAAADSALAGILGELRAQMTAMKESMDQLIEEAARQRHQAPAQQPNKFGSAELLAALTLATQAAPLIRQLLDTRTANQKAA